MYRGATEVISTSSLPISIGNQSLKVTNNRFSGYLNDVVAIAEVPETLKTLEGSQGAYKDFFDIKGRENK